MAKFTIQQKALDPETGMYQEMVIECDAYEGPDEFGLVKFIDAVETPAGTGKKLLLLLDWEETVSIRRDDTEGNLSGSAKARGAGKAAPKAAEVVGAST